MTTAELPIEEWLRDVPVGQTVGPDLIGETTASVTTTAEPTTAGNFDHK